MKAHDFGGSGPCVILLHGFGADRQTWLGNTPDLIEHAKVWALDLPGHGDSWQSTPPPSLGILAEQILEQVKSLSDEPVHFIGHSLGGSLALIAATLQAERVSSVTSMAPAGLGDGLNMAFLKNYPQLKDAEEIFEQLQLLAFDPRMLSRMVADFVLTSLNRDGVRQALTTVASSLINGQGELQQVVEQVAESDLKRQVIWGQQDAIDPLHPPMQAQFGGQWHVLDKCGHLPHIEHRTTVNRLLVDFISES